MNRSAGSAAVVLTLLACALSVSAADAPKADAELLQGRWTLASMVVNNGAEQALDKDNPGQITFDGEKYTLTKRMWMGRDREVVEATESGRVKIVASKDPKEIDLIERHSWGEAAPQLGIYALAGDKLVICYRPFSKVRPADFEAKEMAVRLTFARAK